MSARYEVLVYGPLFCDLIFADLPSMPSLGKEIFAGDFVIAPGGSAIVAVALHRLGVRVGLIADLGSDPLSRVIREMLREAGLDAALIREHPYPLPQITMALSFPHDRAFVTRFETPDRPIDLAAILRANPARHLHISSFLAAFAVPDAAATAHAAGMSVSFDPGWDADALRDPRLRAVLRDVDVFLPSAVEVCQIAGLADSDQALERLIREMAHGLIVMKQGKSGATARTPSQRVHMPALAVTPVDTTGAGDAFDAGFLCAYLRSLPLNDCLRYGNVCGALATTALGGASAAPTRQEVVQWLSRLPS
jgi:sugar/nucleoside kinase (ribokinase family)